MIHKVLLPSVILLWWSASCAAGFGFTASFLPSSEVAAEEKFKYRSHPAARLLPNTKNPLKARGDQVRTHHLRRQRLAPSSSFSDKPTTLIMYGAENGYSEYPKNPNMISVVAHVVMFTLAAALCIYSGGGYLITIRPRHEPRNSTIVSSTLIGLMACVAGFVAKAMVQNGATNPTGKPLYIRVVDVAFTRLCFGLGFLVTVLQNEPQVYAIVASALTGLMASVFGYAPEAAFCGSFAGMSAHISSIGTAMTMALAVSIIYGIFDAGKILVGVGGRLGLIALLSNLFVISVGLVDKVSIQDVMMDMVQKLGGWKITRNLSVLVLMTKLASRIPVVKDISSIKMAIKAIMMMLMAFSSGIFGAVAETSFIALFSCSFAIFNPMALPVWSFALIGLMGALVLPEYADAIYLGLFIGTTDKSEFRSGKAVQASIVATMVFVSGLWNGFGGQLGTQAVVSVLFSLL